MHGPEVTLDEGMMFRKWLAQFGLELMTTVINDHIYLVDLRSKNPDGTFNYYSSGRSK